MPIPTSAKKTFFAVLKVAISVTILSWLFYDAAQENQFSEIANREKNWAWLTTALLLCLLAHFISFVRWRMLVQAIDIPFSTVDAIRIGLIGVFFGLFTLGVVGGDSLRIYYASRHAKDKLAQVICSVFADRAIGMLTMFSIATVGFVVLNIDFDNPENPQKLKTLKYACLLISIATAIGWGTVLGFVFAPKLLSTSISRGLSWVPKVDELAKQLASVVLLYRSRMGVLFASVLWSIAVNICFIGSVYLIAVGLNIVHPPLAKHCVIAPISMASNAIPLPGGLGGMEFVLSFFYDAMSTQNAKLEYGIVVALVFRFMLITMASIGAVAWFANRKQIQAVVEEHEKAVDSTSKNAS